MHGYQCFEPGAGLVTMGLRRLSADCKKKKSGHFSLNSATVLMLGILFCGGGGGKGGLWGISFIVNILCFGAEVSSVIWPEQFTFPER